MDIRKTRSSPLLKTRGAGALHWNSCLQEHRNGESWRHTGASWQYTYHLACQEDIPSSHYYKRHKEVLVPALVMEPGSGHSDIFPLCIIRASRPLIVFTSNQKFHRCIFGQVMKQSLFIHTSPETVMHNQQLMFGYCFKVQPRMHLSSPPLQPSAPRSYAV